MGNRRRKPLFISWLIYCGFRFALGLYGFVPARRAYDWGARVAALFYPLFAGRRKTAVDNLLKSGVAEDPQEADRIAREAFGHFVGHLCEALKVGQVVTPENCAAHLTFEGPDDTRELLFDRLDEPVIILSAHHGAWEAAATLLSFRRPMMAVARKMNNPYIARYLKRAHFRRAITLIPKKKGFTPQVIREWRRTCAALVLIMDQRANRKQGIVIDFMGRPACTHTSPARLHLVSGAPLLVGSFIREAPFHYKIITGHPIRYRSTGDREADVRAILTEVNRRLGEIIRRYPGQYLWAHNRWKLP